MFRNRQFAAANVVTFLVYGALGGLFFFLVMDLQVVAGFSPVLSGSALLPVTVIVLLLSAQAGALSAKIHSGAAAARPGHRCLLELSCLRRATRQRRLPLALHPGTDSPCLRQCDEHGFDSRTSWTPLLLC
jgi:hypothetical protein